MGNKRRPRSARQQRHVRKQVQKVARQVDSMSFCNLLTAPELLGQLEALLPEYRERKYHPDRDPGNVPGTDSACRRVVPERGERGDGQSVAARHGAGAARIPDPIAMPVSAGRESWCRNWLAQ